MAAMARVLLVWLDGYDPDVAATLIAEGGLPSLRKLAARSARFVLDHGSARWSGLAGEQLSTGLSPADAGRWSAVSFDPARYAVWQEGTSTAPFPAALPVRTVVFDPPYFDLARAPVVRGIVDWGAHDPGAKAASRPESLRDEIARRFGPYPAADWIYGLVWPSPERAAIMGDALAKAVEVRAAAAHWLLAERCPDWELAYVVSGELHSAAEALWHGFDASHPLHAMPSALPARRGLLATYEAVDRMVGRLAQAFPDAALVVCSLHGMGPNTSDLASMALLPELLFRGRFGRALLDAAPTAANRAPLLGEDENWTWALRCRLGGEKSWSWRLRRLARRRSAAKDESLAAAARRADGTPVVSIEWIPATWYRAFWPAMLSFALPSFYDGRIRANLAGREAHGRVPPRRYAQALDEAERLLRECRDLDTGAPVAASIERRGGDPLRRGPSEADMLVLWRGLSRGFVHPRLGRIGPLPMRRSGGHTGGHGFAYVAAPGLAPGDRGLRSAFDVVPTVVDLLGAARPLRLSGTSLLAGGVAHEVPRDVAAD
jgi:predicted AlkP superfamily phosphohydrolase/phosphomutase